MALTVEYVNYYDGRTAPWCIVTSDTYIMGFLTNWGSVLSYFSKIGDTFNMVNHADHGREIQQSYYASWTPSEIAAGNATRWPSWNPVQGGNGIGADGITEEITATGDTLYIRCLPRLWANADAPQSVFEQWITFEGLLVRLNYRFTYTGTEDRPGVILYEAPACYTNNDLVQFVHYPGHFPWTGGELERTFLGRYRRYASECWGALLDYNGYGIGLYVPERLMGYHVLRIGATTLLQPAVFYGSGVPVGYVLNHSACLTLGTAEEIRSRFHAEFVAHPPKHEVMYCHTPYDRRGHLTGYRDEGLVISVECTENKHTFSEMMYPTPTTWAVNAYGITETDPLIVGGSDNWFLFRAYRDGVEIDSVGLVIAYESIEDGPALLPGDLSLPDGFLGAPPPTTTTTTSTTSTTTTQIGQTTSSTTTGSPVVTTTTLPTTTQMPSARVNLQMYYSLGGPLRLQTAGRKIYQVGFGGNGPIRIKTLTAGIKVLV